MFSVIIPLYNKELSINNTIQSVLDQTFQDFEIVIVNDGSTDNSVKVVEQIDDKRIRLIHQENKGVSAARNKGMKESKYDLISLLDGDDLWESNFLSTMYKLSTKFPEAGLYSGQYVMINRKKEVVKLDRFPPIKEGYFDLFEYLYAVWSSAVTIRKKVFETTKGFDESLTHGEDTDMWIRIALKYKVCYTSEIVSNYNVGGNPLTRSVGKMPPYNKRFMSRTDNYYIDGNEKWNNLMCQIKINGLRSYLNQYPFNKEIQNKIKELPKNIRENEGWLNMQTLPTLTFVKSVFTLYPKNLVRKIRNRVLLFFNI